MLGLLKLPLKRGRYFSVYGGPYAEKPRSMVGVKMAVEINRACSVNVPVKDFHTPAPMQLRRGLIKTVRAITQGKRVYVGCMGGKGRTGLMLAVLAKSFGVEKPVEYVRANYYAHAVETPEQYKFVEVFRIPAKVQRMIFWARFFSVFSFRKNLTKAAPKGKLPKKKEMVW